MRAIPLVAFLFACGGSKEPDVDVTPSSIAWGDIDFQALRPDAGYDPIDLTVRNVSDKEVVVVIEGFDSTHLALNAPLLANDDPPTFNPLGPGQTAAIAVAVWDYEAGERDTEVSGTLRFATDGSPAAEVPWSFTPIRLIDTDTFQ